MPQIMTPAAASPEQLKCDVCRHPSPVYYLFTNRAFTVIQEPIGIVDVDAGHWALCDACNTLIESANYDAMARVCYQDEPKLLANKTTMEHCAAFMQQLSAAIIGTPVRYTLDQLREEFYRKPA